MVDRVINTPETITVSSIKPVQPGKKMGAVYDVSGQRWGVWGSELDKFTEGGVYKILSHKEGEFMGSILKTVGEFEYIGAPTPATQKANNAAKANGQGAPTYAGGDAEALRRRDIFVCGSLNNMLSGRLLGDLTAPALIETVNVLKTVWEQTLGPNARAAQPAPTRQNTDMSDDIPF